MDEKTIRAGLQPLVDAIDRWVDLVGRQMAEHRRLHDEFMQRNKVMVDEWLDNGRKLPETGRPQ